MWMMNRNADLEMLSFGKVQANWTEDLLGGILLWGKVFFYKWLGGSENVMGHAL